MAKATKVQVPAEYTERLLDAAKQVEQAEKQGRSVGVAVLGKTLTERPAGVTVSAALDSVMSAAAAKRVSLPGLSKGNCSKYETLYREFHANGKVPTERIAEVPMGRLHAAYLAFMRPGAKKRLTAKEVVDGLIDGTLKVPAPEKKQGDETLLKVKKETAARVKELGGDVDGTINRLLDNDGLIDANTKKALAILLETSETGNSEAFLKWAKKIAARERMKVPA